MYSKHRSRVVNASHSLFESVVVTTAAFNCGRPDSMTNCKMMPPRLLADSKVEQLPRECDGFVESRDCSVQLLFVDSLQDCADAGTGCEAEREHMAAEQDGGGRAAFDAKRAGALEE